MRYPTEVNIIADAKAALAEILPLLRHKTERSWRDKIERRTSPGGGTSSNDSRCCRPTPSTPCGWCGSCLSRLPADAIVTGRFRLIDQLVRALSASSAQGHGARCPGRWRRWARAIPYAIGAKFAHPDRPAIALVGDGAMQMNGLAELLTVRRYWRDWSDPRLVVCVFHNNDLAHVTWELRAMSRTPSATVTTNSPTCSAKHRPPARRAPKKANAYSRTGSVSRRQAPAGRRRTRCRRGR